MHSPGKSESEITIFFKVTEKKNFHNKNVWFLESLDSLTKFKCVIKKINKIGW